MESALEAGIQPTQIAFVSFTKGAVQVARDRAIQRFNLTERDLPYFRTLHSMAFRELGLTRSDVLGEDHLTELSEATGELVTDVNPAPDAPALRRNADELLTIDHLARTTRRGLEAAWRYHGGDVDWHRLKRFSAAYRQYKTDRQLLDFTDLLTAYVATQLPPAPIRLAIADEAQDFTLAQYAVADKAFAGADETYFAGDDLQAIHVWAGAAEDHFLSLPHAREVLPLSHRLPVEIFNFAEAVAARVSRRYAKDWRPQPRAGRVEWVNRPEEVDLSLGSREAGRLDWLLLARTRTQLSELIQVARDQGVPYSLKGELSVKPAHVIAIRAYEALRAGRRVTMEEAQEALRACGVRRELKESATYTAAELNIDARPIWHDALLRIPLADREYYLACLRRGEKLDGVPRVRIDTMHGVKGMEAERVLLRTDLTYRTQRGYELDPDAELRVFYVGLTRASMELYLCAPQTAYGFPL